MLLATFQVTNIAIFPLTPQENVTALEFEELAEPHDAQFVEETAEDNYEDSACIPEEGGSVIDIDCKTRAVDYWKGGKSKPRTLEGTEEIRTRIDQARNILNKTRKVLSDKDLSLRLNVRVLKCYMFPVLLYAMKAWMLKQDENFDTLDKLNRY
ncbi:hypothetical protein Trydic_g10817 [Trypoxylus dichotomus]